MVDCVLYFEGDRDQTFRILRAVKNRFGSTNEIGIFVMESQGLLEVDNPSQFLLSERLQPLAGSAVTATIEGTRPVLVEIQALLSDTAFGTPRRMTNGVDYNRVSMLMAVLEKRVGLYMGQQDAYVNVVGGLRITEPAADLATALAVCSSFQNRALQPGLVSIGEVGLTGEIRGVAHVELRIREAEKLGFKRCLIPQANLKGVQDDYSVEIWGVQTLSEAIDRATGG